MEPMTQAEENEVRYLVGIDLGTTNCSVAFIDRKRGRSIHDWPVPQTVAPDETEARDTLPSFLLTGSGETDHVAGFYARDESTTRPGHVVVSAKSWLCHAGVNRTGSILPWHADEGVSTVSPVEASAAFLHHIRNEWNRQHPGEPLEDQDVVVTVPASFDETARTLTIEAARAAGLNDITLLEEPLSAFYAWLSRHEETWPETVQPGETVLVCDIGGGTTDFSLIRALPEADGSVRFHRLAVGEHLILGGDNLDLALAHAVEQDSGVKLDPRRWGELVRSCRAAKELLLSENAPENITLHVGGSGRGLVGGGFRHELKRERCEHILMDGFLPFCDAGDTPKRGASGFREFGLPYAFDTGITRYLAAFLARHLKTEAGDLQAPDWILFNGGFFASPVVRTRLVDVMRTWFGQPGREPGILDHERLDLAVSRGASYFAGVRKGSGVRVVSRLARTYYMDVDANQRDGKQVMLCIAPASLQEGETRDVPGHTFLLSLKSPVSFPMYVSSLRTEDRLGDLVAADEDEWTPIPPLRTVLKTGKSAKRLDIEAVLQVRLTENGRLEIHCREHEGDRSWMLPFDVRAATDTTRSYHQGTGEQAGMVDDETVSHAKAVIHAILDHRGATRDDCAGLMKKLEKATGLVRSEWPPSLLRAMAETLMEKEAGRSFSPHHEARWLNLAGYALRPGFGFALDDWRIQQGWRLYPAYLHHPGDDAVRAEWWILWRRISGGLSAGQQATLAGPVLAAIRKGRTGSGAKAIRYRPGTHESAEMIRLAGSLERLSVEEKIRTGDTFLEMMAGNPSGPDARAALWAIGRIGAREPAYGEIDTVVGREAASTWMERILAWEHVASEPAGHLTLAALGRRTGDRYLDIDDDLRTRCLTRLRNTGASQHLIELLDIGGAWSHDESAAVLGDALPVGLRLKH